MQQFEIILKNEKIKFYDRIAIFIFILNGAGIIVALLNSSYDTLNKTGAIVFLCLAIALLISLLNTGSTYETIAEAKAKPGKFVHVAVKLDKTMPVEYDPTKDANYLSFHAVAMDNPDQTMKVVYRNGEIPNLKISERLVLKGKYENDHFECKDVQTKCPSKYKEEMKPTEKSIETSSVTNSEATK